MESNSAPSSGSTPTSSTIPTIDSSNQCSSLEKSARGNIDPSCYHCNIIEFTSSRKGKLPCLYSQRIFLGGGIHRVKQYIVDIKCK